MNPKSYSVKKKQLNHFNVFPENRDFFFLDSADKISGFKTTNLEDPEYITVVTEKDKQIKENLYIRKDFLTDYEFIKVTEKVNKIDLNFIASKNKINIGGSETRLLTEIKLRPSMIKEIFRKTNVNFDTKDMTYLKELFTIPTELKFYNRVFILFFQERKPNNFQNNQSQQNYNVNNNYNINNNNYNGSFNNANNIMYGCGNFNKDNNIGNNPYQFYNNTNTPGYNNNNINIINNNSSMQNDPNFYLKNNNINNNNINNNNNNQSNQQYLQNNNNGVNLDPKTYQINNNNANNNYSYHDYKTYIYDFKSKTNNDINQLKSNQNQPYNQYGNLNNTNIPQNNYQNYNNVQNKNGNKDIEMRDETGKNYKAKFNSQSESNNVPPGAYPTQTRNPQQGSYSLQQGAYPPHGNLSNQPGANISQPGSNNSQSGSNNSQQGSNNSQQPPNPPNAPKPNYLFSKKGLKNIGSTCYMNATLQCLLHVNELITYFIEEYPKDQQQLAKINNDVASGGDISRAFFNLVIGVNENSELVMSKKNLKPKTKKKSGFNVLGVFGFDNDYDDSSYDRAFAPIDFKRTLGIHNPMFKSFGENDLKDLILYLLQTMHEELNYYGNINKRLKYIPNQYNIYESYNHFTTNYNTNNFSKISLLFYGTYQNTITCLVCRKKLYNFQKFEFISFGMYYYHKHRFNILNGFQDNANPTILKGEDKFLCNNCKKLQEAKTECKIFEPPLKLLINLDYGKNNKYQPSSIEFDEEIDITKFVEFDYKQKIRYRIIGVCTHYGHSGSYGHYVAFCRNTQTDTWYEFNDSFCSECNKREIYRGSPYLLLYERIFN